MDKRSGAGMRWVGLAVLACAPAWGQKVYSTLPEAPPERAHARSTLNLRAGPGTDTPVVARLAAGEAVELAGCDRPAGWCEVVLGPGRRAWASAPHLVREGRMRVDPGPTHIEIPPPAGPPVVVEIDPRRR